MAESLAEFFLEHFSSHAGECAYKQKRGYRMESCTYGGVLRLAPAFAGELDRRGIAKGERIMLWGENSAEWVAVFFGCTLRGVVVVPMDDGASADFAARVFRQVQAKLLVSSRQHASDAAAAQLNPAMIFEDIRSLPDSRHEGLPKIGISRENTLQIVFTSGTTAEPRGVVISHGNVLSNISPLEREMQRSLKYERLVHPIRFLNLLPLSHVFGQFLTMYLPPLLGGTVIFQQELKPSEVVRTIRRERVSVLVSVPRVLQSLKQKVKRDLEDRKQIESFRQRFAAAKDKHFLHRWWIFRRIRRQFGWKFWAFISGGAALDSETEEFWGRLGYAVIQGYGLTETTSLVSVNHPFRLGKGSIGKVLPGREVKLAPDGEILVRGSGIASGYWDASGAHSVSNAEGWYRTGDIGALDEAGNLYFKGRKKEVIVTPGGTNVYPEDLEAALRRQPEVKDCVVVGVERGGNAEPCAVVILRDYANVEKVVQSANESLADYQRMRLWMEWPQEDFPRTSTQKPKRNLIAETVKQVLFQPPNQERAGWGAPASPLRELIAQVSGRAAPACATGRKPGCGPRPQFPGSRGIDERPGRSVSSRSERSALQRSAHGWRSGTDAARGSCAGSGIPLPQLDAALAGHVDSAAYALPASAPGGFSAGLAANCGSREPARRSRAAAGDREPYRGCRSRIHSDGTAGAFQASSGDRCRRRSAGGAAQSRARPWILRKNL